MTSGMSTSSDWRLSDEQFEQACEGRRFTDRGRMIAYEQLVLGRAAEEVARQYKVSRNRAFFLRRQVYSAFLELSDYPPDWITVKITASPELLKAFNAQVQKKLKAWRKFKSEANSAPGFEEQ